MEEGGVLPQGNTGYTRGVSGTHLETNSTLVQKFNLDHFDLTEIVQYCHAYAANFEVLDLLELDDDLVIAFSESVYHKRHHPASYTTH